VPGWVTVFGQVNHLGEDQAPRPTQPEPASVIRLEWVPGESWGSIAWYTSPYPWYRSICWCLAVGLACRDLCQHTGSGSALEVLCNDALYSLL